MMQPPVYSRRLSGLVRNVTYPAAEYSTFANYVCVVEEYYPKLKKKSVSTEPCERAGHRMAEKD
jgi:hypothetical protein